VRRDVDAFLLARLTRELDENWRDAWVQQAWQDLEARLVLQLRRSGPRAATRFLLLSPLPHGQGLGTVRERPRAPHRPPALAAYLRAHVTGGRLEFARCGSFERIVELGIRAREGTFRLMLEATGRRANVVVVDPGGRVRAAWRWEPPETHPLRPLEPGGPYALPPRPKGSLTPVEVTREAWVAWAAAGEPLHRRVAGLGPTLAREVATEGWEALQLLVSAYGEPGSLWEYPEGLFSAPLGHLGEPRAIVDEALDSAGTWLEGASGAATAAAAEAAAERRAAEHRGRLTRRLEKIRLDLARLEDPAELRNEAAALAAALSTVRRGAPEALVPSLTRADTTVLVRLDPARSPGENVDRLYEAAKRVERARDALRARIAETETELAGGKASEEPAETGGRVLQGQPYRRFRAANGWSIWVGRNGRENDRLLREAKPWDLWLHARDFPGAHVLLRLPGREAKVPEAVVLEAAVLAVRYSRGAGGGSVDVMVAQAGRVRKPKGASPGRVVASGERTVRVRPVVGGSRSE
jgi:predicted ribosome quality control (RQC) complex YloA/Tae2 family protein